MQDITLIVNDTYILGGNCRLKSLRRLPLKYKGYDNTNDKYIFNCASWIDGRLDRSVSMDTLNELGIFNSQTGGYIPLTKSEVVSGMVPNALFRDAVKKYNSGLSAFFAKLEEKEEEPTLPEMVVARLAEYSELSYVKRVNYFSRSFTKGDIEYDF